MESFETSRRRSSCGTYETANTFFVHFQLCPIMTFEGCLKLLFGLYCVAADTVSDF